MTLCRSRRGMLTLGAGIVFPDIVQAAQGPQAGDVFVRADGAEDRTPIRAEAILLNAAPIVAWPMERATGLVRNTARNNQVLLLRVEAPATAVQVMTQPEGRLLAFSAICTHAGCLVSDWIASTRYLHCPCHGSEFDPAKNAAVVAGPAPESLPMVPIDVADGLVVATGGFSKPPGGHTSRTM